MAGLLGSIGSIAGGVSSGLSAEAQQALQRYAAQAARDSLAGNAAAGNALSGYTGQGSPLGALGPAAAPSLPPAPQQPSAPAASQPAGMFQPSMSQPYGQASGGFQDALKFTLGQEGGLNPSDTNNTPTNLGINQQANPDVNVQALTPQTAAPIYKQRYWDAINGDQLPAPLQKMAFDTAVMSGPQVAKAMLQASGGDAQKFMALRQQFQSKLLQADPDKYGKYAQAWAKRNAALAGGAPPPQQSGTPGGQAPQPAPGVPSVAAIQQMPLQDIVQLVRRNNPNLRGGALLDAVKSIQGVMNPEAQMQLRLIQAQLAATKAQEQFYLGNRRADTAQEGVQERERHDTATEGQGQERIDQRGSEFEQRQAAQRERFDASLKEKYDAIKATDTRADKNRLATDARSAIKDQLAAERAEISAANVLGPDRDRLMKEAAERADESNKRLDEALKAKSAEQPAEGGDIQTVQTPEEAAKLKPGTHYKTPDGQEYVR